MLSKTSILPSPFKVIINFYNESFDSFSLHLFWSFYRILTGIFSGGILGLFFGVLLGYEKTLDLLLEPYLYILNLIPKISLLPLFIVFLGIGETSKILIIFSIVFFQILISVRDSTRLIEEHYLLAAKSINSKFSFIFSNLIFPRILPSFLTSLKVSLTTALAVLFISETYATQYGLGYYVMDSLSKMDYTNVFTGIVCLTLLGYGLFSLISLIEKKFCFWALQHLNQS